MRCDTVVPRRASTHSKCCAVLTSLCARLERVSFVSHHVTLRYEALVTRQAPQVRKKARQPFSVLILRFQLFFNWTRTKLLKWFCLAGINRHCPMCQQPQRTTRWRINVVLWSVTFRELREKKNSWLLNGFFCTSVAHGYWPLQKKNVLGSRCCIWTCMVFYNAQHKQGEILSYNPMSRYELFVRKPSILAYVDNQLYTYHFLLRLQ